MALSISDHCRSCIVSLQEVISILSQPDHNVNHVKSSQVCEELDRFSLFIGNIGALHQPKSPLSIESRLQDANDVLTHILGLLTDLNDVSAELLDIVSGRREGMVTIADEGEEEGEVISEANELREEISETITRLFRVSILIRQAAPTDVFAKALSRNRYHFSDQFDIAHVGEKYHKLATEDFAWLRQRLGRAITQRRHYLSYIHDHRDKLGDIPDRHDKLDSTDAKNQAPVTKQPLDLKPLLDAESRPSFFTKATTIAAERIIPQLHVAGDEDPDEDARSYTTVSRSIDGDHESSANIRIPRLDTLRTGPQNEFECPFCFRIKKFKSERIWRKHVFSDLRPYVCTFPNCDAPYFGDINRWFQHEMMFHRVTYNCFLCQKVYYQEEKYLSHLRHEHGETLDDGGAQVGTDLARKPLAQIPASDCPCCSDWANRLSERITQTTGSAPTGILAVTPTMFKRHLAAHLEQLALFAIPIGAAADDDKDSNAAIEEARSERTNTSQASALTFQSLRGNLDGSNSETEMDPSRNMVSQTDTQGTEIETERTVRHTPSLSASSNERRHQDNSKESSPVPDEDILRLGAIVRQERMKYGDYHPNLIPSMKDLAMKYQEHKRWIEASNVLTEVLETITRTAGPDHDQADTLAVMKNLASCYEAQDDWSEAITIYTKMHEMNNTNLGPKHVDTLDSLQQLASYYHKDEQFPQASAKYKELLSAYEEVLGRDHEKTLSCIEALVGVLEEQRDLTEAEHLQRELISRQGIKHGHENTLGCRRQLVLILEDQGKYDEAEAVQREIVLESESLYGPHGTATLLGKEELASILVNQLKYEEAEVLQREVVSEYENLYGPQNMTTLRSKPKLVHILSCQGKYNDAKALQREVVSGYENLYGPQNESTLLRKEELASILSSQGKYDEAEALQREVVLESESVHGTLDTLTLSSKEELASILANQQKYDEAEVLQRKAVSGWENVFGLQHTVTLSSKQELASILIGQEDYDEAELVQREALVGIENEFGSEDARTRDSMQRLAQILKRLGKLNEALVLYEKLFTINEKLYGSHDVRTMQSISELAMLQQRLGNSEEAESLFREAFVRHRTNFGFDHLGVLSAAIELADILSNNGKYEEAELRYREALIESAKSYGIHNGGSVTVANGLVSTLVKQGKFEEAENVRREQLMASERGFGRNHSLTVGYMNILGDLLLSHKKLQEAEELYREVFDIHMRSDRESEGPRPSEHTRASMRALASVQEKQGKFGAAEATYRQVMEISTSVPTVTHIKGKLEVISSLFSLLVKQGKFEEADGVRKQVLELEEILAKIAHGREGQFGRE